MGLLSAFACDVAVDSRLADAARLVVPDLARVDFVFALVDVPVDFFAVVDLAGVDLRRVVPVVEVDPVLGEVALDVVALALVFERVVVLRGVLSFVVSCCVVWLSSAVDLLLRVVAIVSTSNG